MKFHRITAAELAPSWNVQPRRVVDILRNAGVRRAADRTYDAAEANAVRREQVARDPVRCFVQGVANQHGTLGSKLDGLLAKSRVVPMTRTITPADYDSDPLGEADDANNSAAMASIITAGQMAVLRAEEVRARIDQRLMKSERERGLLINRAEVAKQGERAGRQIMAVVSTLPAELAALFPDPEGRAEVRRTVQARIDQVMFAINKSVATLMDDVQ